MKPDLNRNQEVIKELESKNIFKTDIYEVKEIKPIAQSDVQIHNIFGQNNGINIGLPPPTNQLSNLVDNNPLMMRLGQPQNSFLQPQPKNLEKLKPAKQRKIYYRKNTKIVEHWSDSEDSYNTSQEVVLSSSSDGTSSSEIQEPKKKNSVLSRVVNTVGAFIKGTEPVKPPAKRGRPTKKK